MAPMLSKSLLLSRPVLHHRSSFLRRRFSSKPELIEVVLDPSSSPAAAVNKMEELIHSILVEKCTPDWLPFLPGSSFWVPQPRHGSKRVSDFIDRLRNQLTPDEYLSLTTGRGWPCASFLFSDGEYTDVSSMDVNLKYPEQEEEEEDEEEEEEKEEVKVDILIDSDDKSS